MKKNILSLGAFLASSAIFLSPCTAFAAEGSPDILTTESTIEATADETGNDVVTFSVDDQTIVSDEVENSADYIGNNAYTDGLFGTKYEVTGPVWRPERSCPAAAFPDPRSGQGEHCR